MTVAVSGDSITFPDNSVQNTAPTGFGFKNRIINGAMVIDQRALGTVTINSSNTYTTDRWTANQTAAGKYSVENSTTAPAGFTNSYLATSLSAYSVSSTDIFFFQQNIEGYNFADLGWGTADAQPITLSFRVRSSLTGTFGGCLANSAHNRSYPFSYTISSANTWETKTITVTGDTTGTWLTNNGVGLQVIFGLGGGSTRSGTAGSWQASTLYTATGATSVVGTSGATFYITGVQLEKGSTATSFDYRPYGTELGLCQRYYQHMTSSTSSSNYNSYGTGFGVTSTFAFVQIPLLTAMRSSPTLTNSTVSQFRVGFITCTALAINSASPMNVNLRADVSSGLTINQGCQFDSNNNQTSYIGLSSEL